MHGSAFIRLFASLPLLLASCQPQSQDAPADTRISVQDSIRVFQLLNQANDVQNTNPDSAFVLIKQSGALSRQNHFDKGIFNYYQKAMYNRAAFRGDFALATRMSDTALALMQEPKRQRFWMMMYFSRGLMYQIQEKNDSSIIYYLRALDSQQLNSDTARVPVIQNNLAALFHAQQRDDLAVEYELKYFKKAVSLADTAEIIAACINLYEFKTAQKDTVTAFSYLSRGLTLAANPNPWSIKADLDRSAGAYYLAKRNPDSARHYFTQFYNLTKQLYPPAYLAQPLIGIAQTDWLVGDMTATEKRLNEAARLTTIDSLPLFDRKTYYQTQYELLRKTGRSVQALAALEKYNRAVAEFEGGQKNQQLTNYYEQVRQLRHEKQLTDRQYTLDRKNSLIVALIVSSLLLSILATVLVLYWRKRKMLESEKLAKLHLETEWNTLKSRMAAQQEERNRISQELHDELGAALTSISLASELLRQNEPTHSAEVQIIARASSEMTTRMNEIVWSLNVNNDNVQSLVAYIRKFCADFLGEAGIQMIFTETITNPERELKGIIRRNVYQSVKEAVHNVVKHAEASRVELAIETVENELHILIRDNGKGMTTEPANLWSNGLRNMRKNIEAIKGRISWNTSNGTQVSIQAPMSV